MYIFIAIIIWLIINYFTWWLDFNPILCFLWGLFLVMPSLLKFKFSDLKVLFEKKSRFLVFLNLIIWFILIPWIFFGVWYMFFWVSSITYAMMFLWFLPWWWMLFNFINKNWWDIKIWVSLFIINLIIFTIIFFLLNHFLLSKWEKLKNIETEKTQTQSSLLFLNDLNKNDQKHCLLRDIWNKINENNQENKQFCPIEKTTWISCGMWKMDINPMAIIIVLVIIPFLISRIVLLNTKITNFLTPKISILSQVATFFIVWYIFTLKDISPIFSVEIFKILSIFWWLFLSYLIIYFILYFIIFKNNKAELDIKISVFLNNWIRFLTMWLIFSFIFAENFWIDFVLVIAIAYITQPIFTLLFSNLIKKWLIK